MQPTTAGDQSIFPRGVVGSIECMEHGHDRDIKEDDDDGEFASCDAARGMATITRYKLKYGEGLASLII